MKKPNITELANEFTYHRYLLNDSHTRRHLKELNISEYIALRIISDTAENDSIYGGKTYLKDLSDKMQVSMRSISNIIANLRDKGLVKWSHDGDGNDGTYVVITDSGITMMKNQEQNLKNYYERVIERFGHDNMVKLIHLMKDLETVMSAELEEKEGITDGN